MYALYARVLFLIELAWTKVEDVFKRLYVNITTLADFIYDNIWNLCYYAYSKLSWLVDTAWTRIETLFTDWWADFSELMENTTNLIYLVNEWWLKLGAIFESNWWDTLSSFLTDPVSYLVGAVWDRTMAVAEMWLLELWEKETG